MTKAPDTRAIVADRDRLPHRLDPERNLIHYIQAPRKERSAATFLTHEHLPGSATPVGVPRATAIDAATRQPAVGFVFHSAFCCSTLVARALDVPGIAHALREPVILNDVIGWRRRGGAPARVAEATDHALRLLGQLPLDGEMLLVKPSNVVNALAPAMMALRPEAHAVFLYAPLDTFLASIASKGMWGRLWVRELWTKLRRDGMGEFGFDADALLQHTDLQVAALGWLAQHRLFAATTARFGGRLATLDTVALLADPARSVLALAAHLRLPIDAKEAREIASGPAFTRHAKFGAAFDRGDRDATHATAAEANRDEIEKVATWARVVAAAHEVPVALPEPLLD